MSRRNKTLLIPIIAGILVLAVSAFLWPTGEASAQCGSQASSCKNCHEVQGQDPVNGDGTGWHQSHAFGDFCYLCHAGNSQSVDKAEAHTGMVPPLSDVEAGCQSCHPNDLTEKAQVYAAALGVEIGAGGGGAPQVEEPQAENPPSAGAVEAGDPPELAAAGEELIDYEAIYEETVAGRKPVNWGNWILVAMIGMVGLGGGGFVYYNERKLRAKRTGGGRPEAADARLKPATESRRGDEALPDEIRELLPQLLQLNPIGLHALKRILENPEDANQLLQNLSRLDPQLIRQLRQLNRDARALLLALAGD
jgi:hypothetical protein